MESLLTLQVHPHKKILESFCSLKEEYLSKVSKRNLVFCNNTKY